MKKCNCIVTYNGSKLYSIYANTENNLIELFRGEKEYNSFNELYENVLLWLKNNNLYVKNYDEFNKKLYNINFIDIYNPSKIERFYKH